jgi:class 3 adenylate cyclase
MTKKNEEAAEKIFDIRIGINTGPVVAGVVGSTKFAYDIWGDTVNVAARMESNSEPGKINISENTYELVKEDFACEYRGEIEAKNRGKLKMYFVNGPAKPVN